MANNAEEVDIIVPLADFLALSEAKEFEDLRNGINLCSLKALEEISLLVHNLEDALRLIRIDVCSQPHFSD